MAVDFLRYCETFKAACRKSLPRRQMVVADLGDDYTLPSKAKVLLLEKLHQSGFPISMSNLGNDIEIWRLPFRFLTGDSDDRKKLDQRINNAKDPAVIGLRSLMSEGVTTWQELLDRWPELARELGQKVEPDVEQESNKRLPTVHETLATMISKVKKAAVGEKEMEQEIAAPQQEPAKEPLAIELEQVAQPSISEPVPEVAAVSAPQEPAAEPAGAEIIGFGRDKFELIFELINEAASIVVSSLRDLTTENEWLRDQIKKENEYLRDQLQDTQETIQILELEVASLKEKLNQVKIMTLEEIAEEFPGVPELFRLAQKIKARAAETGEAVCPKELPQWSPRYHVPVRYEDRFLKTFAELDNGVRRQTVKAVGYIVFPPTDDGLVQNSLQTQRVTEVSGMPGTPVGVFYSRASEHWRVTWDEPRESDQQVCFFGVYKRSDL